jgi:hypothetical protein
MALRDALAQCGVIECDRAETYDDEKIRYLLVSKSQRLQWTPPPSLVPDMIAKRDPGCARSWLGPTLP